MAFVELDRVSVDFPVFDSRGRSLRAALMNVRPGAGKRVGLDTQGTVTVHALQEITTRFDDGDRIGLIGRNGSGKSTLLRLLSGVYEPTRGVLRIDGNCCSLLDLMLGIDVEASGFENILLRGLALGLTLREVRQIEREVADFTELGDHLQLPVRTYSSGMLLRLAFAVSTSMPREIGVIDEVIGAGDSTFMQKARQRLDRMLLASNILVVASHTSELLRTLCTKGLYLREGRVVFFGPIDEALELYALEAQ